MARLVIDQIKDITNWNAFAWSVRKRPSVTATLAMDRPMAFVTHVTHRYAKSVT
jgi:hypothetical protein